MNEFDVLGSAMMDSFIMILLPMGCAIALIGHAGFMVYKENMKKSFAIIEIIVALFFIVIALYGQGLINRLPEAPTVHSFEELDYTPASVEVVTEISATEAETIVTDSFVEAVAKVDLNFWNGLDNKANKSENVIFRNAAQRYSVPESVLRAIYAQETINGKFMGEYFAYQQLTEERHIEALKEIATENDLDYTQIKGSVAGAIGLTQFMPYWWQKFAVDGNNDGRKNPFDLSDAVYSTANYLKEHYQGCWQKAVFAYNPDRDYVAEVMRKAEDFSGNKGKYSIS